LSGLPDATAIFRDFVDTQFQAVPYKSWASGDAAASPRTIFDQNWLELGKFS